MTVTRENLEAALHRALSGAKFDLGQIVTKSPAGSLSSYAGRPGQTLDLEGFRQMYERARRGDESLSPGRTPIVCIPEALRTALADTLRDFLHDYVDSSTDLVGHAFPMGSDHGGAATYTSDGLYTYAQYSSVRWLADSLVKGAAVAGCDRVAGLVAGWADGAPMTYRTCTIVPVTIARAVSPIVGVDIVPLALSTKELPAGLPAQHDKPQADYLGQSLISIDAETRPALFRPVTPSPEGKAVRAALTPPVTLETIREALSLECDAFVDAGLTWDDYGEFYALANRDGGGRGAVGHLARFTRKTTQLETGVSTLELPDDDIRDLSGQNIGRLLKELHSVDARTRVAVSRWKMAMNRMRGLPDRFIDLRIALESLFLPQKPNQELRFRLAVSGAWLVGEDAADRRRVLETLRTAYDFASTAVHQGDVKKEGSACVLADALAVCRRGILRVLQEGPIADWTNLILDCHDRELDSSGAVPQERSRG